MRGRGLLVGAVATGLVVWAMYTPRHPHPLYPIREPAPPAEPGAGFDPARCGAVRGQVGWTGPVPVVPPIEPFRTQRAPEPQADYPNPNAPQVAAGRLAGALVHLTAVDPTRSARWVLPPVSVGVTRAALVVRQGDITGHIGIVQRGGPVELVSREPALHSVRGRGAAFFTQMLPVPDRPVARPMPEAGVVELSSGSGFYWLRGYLLVSDHPYAAVTGADGRFDLSQVPDGEYAVACWVPNWHVERTENDPEWVAPVRMSFRPPVEKRTQVVVSAGRTAELTFTLSAADFESHAP